MSELPFRTSNHLTLRERFNRLNWRARRVRCVLTHCVVAPDYPACWRCDAPIYGERGHEFIDSGPLDEARRTLWKLRVRIKRLVSRKTCENCRRKYWRGYNDHLCCEECFDAWLPF